MIKSMLLIALSAIAVASADNSAFGRRAGLRNNNKNNNKIRELQASMSMPEAAPIEDIEIPTTGSEALDSAVDIATAVSENLQGGAGDFCASNDDCEEYCECLFDCTFCSSSFPISSLCGTCKVGV